MVGEQLGSPYYWRSVAILMKAKSIVDLYSAWGLMAQDGGVSLAEVVLGVTVDCTQGLIYANYGWVGLAA